jgi:hypothetical protein
VGVKIATGKNPPSKTSRTGKTDSHRKKMLIIVRGTGTRFDGIYNLEELPLNLFYVAVVCLTLYLFW